MANDNVTPAPGIYYNIPAAQYFAWSAMNNSTLKNGVRSMSHLKAAQANPMTATPAMRLGSLIHAAALEPGELLSLYVVRPEFDVRKPDGTAYANPKNTKAYRDKVAAFDAANPGRETVTADELERMQGAVRALQANMQSRCMLGSGESEACIVWTDEPSGVLCKARIDKLDSKGRTVTDLKTTADASQFEQAFAKYRYYQQLAFYCDGIATITGNEYAAQIVAVETTPPFGVRCAPVSLSAMETGRAAYRRLIREYATACKTGHFVGYGRTDAWTLPAWAVAAEEQSNPTELTIGGRVVAVN